jgi:hypothetical protein
MKFSKNQQGFGKITLILLGAILVILIVAGFVYAYSKAGVDKLIILDEKVETEKKGEQVIGGDKDEGGCLVGAGYSWCEIKKKCLRVWEEPCVAEEEQAMFEAYLNQNISELSNTKEVLGGKFYITQFRWTGEKSVTVDYEDGHIALQANVSYAIENGQIVVKEFNIVNDNGASTETASNTDEIVLELRALFANKYNIEPGNISVEISDNRVDFLRGSVKLSLDENAPGGYFLAKKVAGQYEIVVDGNGQIDCKLVSDFPADMVSDCAK